MPVPPSVQRKLDRAARIDELAERGRRVEMAKQFVKDAAATTTTAATAAAITAEDGRRGKESSDVAGDAGERVRGRRRRRERTMENSGGGTDSAVGTTLLNDIAVAPASTTPTAAANTTIYNNTSSAATAANLSTSMSLSDLAYSLSTFIDQEEQKGRESDSGAQTRAATTATEVVAPTDIADGDGDGGGGSGGGGGGGRTKISSNAYSQAHAVLYTTTDASSAPETETETEMGYGDNNYNYNQQHYYGGGCGGGGDGGDGGDTSVTSMKKNQVRSPSKEAMEVSQGLDRVSGLMASLLHQQGVVDNIRPDPKPKKANGSNSDTSPSSSRRRRPANTTTAVAFAKGAMGMGMGMGIGGGGGVAGGAGGGGRLLQSLRRDLAKSQRAEKTARRQAKETESRARESVAALETQARERTAHFNTVLASLHTLLAELEDIYRVRGVVAPLDDSGTSGDGVVSQLFSDMTRLLKTLAFGTDGTLEDADCLAAATLKENRRLRATLRARERELKRRRVENDTVAALQRQLADASETIDGLDAAGRELARRNDSLDKEISALSATTLRVQTQLASALGRAQAQESAYAERAEDWQHVIDRTVREAESMRAHAETAATALEAERSARTRQAMECKRLGAEADAQRQRAQVLEDENERLRSDLRTAAAAITAGGVVVGGNGGTYVRDSSGSGGARAAARGKSPLHLTGRGGLADYLLDRSFVGGLGAEMQRQITVPVTGAGVGSGVAEATESGKE